MNKQKSPSSGFTLIELLTVIAIIGILASIIIPTVGTVKTKAAMVTSSSNLRQIALAYNTFSNSGSRTRTLSSDAKAQYTATTRSEWGEKLAEYGELNDGALYFIASSADVSNITIPNLILDGKKGSYAPNQTWADASEEISYNMGVNVSANRPTSSTPLIWTKGIKSDGLWDEDETISPWLNKGGHIAFADGHVTFYEELYDSKGNGVLIDTAGTQVKTPEDALGGTANVLVGTK